MKIVFPMLIGNERIKHTLSNSLSHAYLIEGAPGSGRLTAARNAAAATLCLNRDIPEHPLPCGTCSVCSRIFRGIHPDVTEYSTGDKKSIGVDTARELRAQVFISPVESEYKFFVIRDADLMTPEAQNALLISIEEPPPFSVFFLLVTDKAMLLETIRSRCVALAMERLDDEQIADALRATPEGTRLSSGDSEAFDNAVRSAGGSLGEALRIIAGDDSGDDDVRTAAAELVRVILTGSAADKVNLSATFPRTRDTQEKIFAQALCAVRDIISHKLKTDADLLFYAQSTDLTAFTAIPLIRLMTLTAVIEDARTALSGNSSPMLTAERVIMYRI